MNQVSRRKENWNKGPMVRLLKLFSSAHQVGKECKDVAGSKGL